MLDGNELKKMDKIEFDDECSNSARQHAYEKISVCKS